MFLLFEGGDLMMILDAWGLMILVECIRLALDSGVIAGKCASSKTLYPVISFDGISWTIESAEQAEILLLLDASWRRKQYRPISGALWKWRNVSPTFYTSRDLISNTVASHVAVIDTNSFGQLARIIFLASI